MAAEAIVIATSDPAAHNATFRPLSDDFPSSPKPYIMQTPIGWFFIRRPMTGWDLSLTLSTRL
jgi:hypothetical protein